MLKAFWKLTGVLGKNHYRPPGALLVRLLDALSQDLQLDSETRAKAGSHLLFQFHFHSAFHETFAQKM